MKLPYIKVARHPSAEVEGLLKTMGCEFEPERVPVNLQGPVRQQDLLQCYLLVREHVMKHGGRMRLGWVLMETDIVVQAQHHAVWQPPNSDDLICITPREPMVREILFVLDERWEYLDRDIPNYRISYPKNRLIEDYILIQHTKELIESQCDYVGDRMLKVDEKYKETYQALSKLEEDYLMFISKGNKLHDSCFCNSGKKYKECHGLDVSQRMASKLSEFGLSLEWMPPIKHPSQTIDES